MCDTPRSYYRTALCEPLTQHHPNVLAPSPSHSPDNCQLRAFSVTSDWLTAHGSQVTDHHGFPRARPVPTAPGPR